MRDIEPPRLQRREVDLHRRRPSARNGRGEQLPEWFWVLLVGVLLPGAVAVLLIWKMSAG